MSFKSALRRLSCRLVVLLAIASGYSFLHAENSLAQQYRYATSNFVVLAPDPAFAKKVGNEAERFRKELAVLWLDRELPAWSEKCPIRVSIAPHAGGETSFAFNYMGQQRGEPTQWNMKIYGSPERILDSVLPHEVTHTIFATHFRRPLPRWADEGACTTVEHASEKSKNHGMLIQFLTNKPSRGIPFNRMFTMKDYPPDILPLYAQGFSVAKFLIMEKGRKHFLDYVEAGLNLERPGNELAVWNSVTNQYYGYRDLSDLQISWQKWVADGSKEKAIPPNNALKLASSQNGTPKRNASRTLLARAPQAGVGNRVSSMLASENSASPANAGWYAKQMRVGRREQNELNANATSQQQQRTNSKATIWR